MSFKNGHRDCDGNEKDANASLPRNADYQFCKRIEVVVGGEPLGQKNVLSRATPRKVA